MAGTGYGRISTINRIPYYRSASSRSYRGVKTPKMVADITLRMSKAQDQSERDAFNNGQISTDQYIAYLTNKISTASDPTYRNSLTQELQNVTVTDNEKILTQGYSDGTVTAGQLESYFKNKLASLDPNSQIYQTTQNQVAKWTRAANSDAYKSQKAVLQEQYNAAADKLGPAQKMLDFLVQYSQTLDPNSAEYQSALGEIGTYQSEVRKLTFQQQLLQAEDKISQTYAKDTPENWQAKSQAYAQLRDAAAQQGDITNFYKYDQLANTAQDNVTSSQQRVVQKQVTDAVKQTEADYLSGKISGEQAQAQYMQISDAALSAGDTNGVVVAHDYYNRVENDINHGVTYGADNGFGKTKGGSGGDNGWYDGTANAPVVSSASSSSSVGSSAGSSASSNTLPSSVKSVANLKASTSGTQIQGLDQILQSAKFMNPTTQQLNDLASLQSQGASTDEMVLYLRAQKVGTGDGWNALKQLYNNDLQQINQKLGYGYDPVTGQAYNAQDAMQEIRGEQTAIASLYLSWQNYVKANPNAKINVDGTNKKVATLQGEITDTLNGTFKTDKQTGLTTKDTPGLLDAINTPLDPQNTVIIETAPGVYMPVNKAQYEAQNGSLVSKGIQDEAGVWHLINNNNQKPITDTFNTLQQAQADANKFNKDNAAAIQAGQVQAVQAVDAGNGSFTVTKPNMTARTVTVGGPNGTSITYYLNGDNSVEKAVPSEPGILPAGYSPKTVMTFGGATESVPASKMGFKLSNQTMAQPTQANPANTSTAYGPRYTSMPSNANESRNTQGIGTNNFSSVKGGATFVGQPNTSTRNGAVYTPGPMNNPVVQPTDNRISITNTLFGSNPLLNNPINKFATGALDTLIQNVFGIKPPMNIAPASIIPPQTPLRTQSGNVSFPTQTQQVNQSQPSSQASAPQSPSAPSAPISVAGNQPQNNIQKNGGNMPQLNLGSVPKPQFQNTGETLWGDLGNVAKGFGNAIGGGWNAVNNGLNGIASGISSMFKF